MASPALSKGVVIRAFRNGDIHDSGVRLVIHPTKFLTFDQVLDEMTRRVKLPTGTVRRVFAPDGREIKAMEEFESQGAYICCGAHRLKKDQLPKAAVPKGSGSPGRSPAKRSTSTPKKKQKFGVQTAKGKVVWVYRNGDKHHTGDRFVVHETRYKKLDQLYSDITNKVGVSTGAVRKIVVMQGDGTAYKPKLVKSFVDIRDHTNVVACGAESLQKDLLHASFFEPREKESKKEARLPTVDQETPVSASPAHSEVSTPTKKMEKFGTQTDKGVVIYVYRNGDKHDEGTRMVVHAKKHRRMDQVHSEMTQKVGVVTGAVRKVYTPKGTLIKEISQFRDQNEYICAGAEALKKNLISSNLIARRNERVLAARAARAEKEAEAATSEAEAVAEPAAAEPEAAASEPAAEAAAAEPAADDDMESF